MYVNIHSLIDVNMRDSSTTKKKIHQAALTLFVEKGVAETTVRDLSRSAGIAEGTLYRHYASMADLIWDLFSSNYAAFAQHLNEVLIPFDNFPDKWTAIVKVFCRFYDDEPDKFRFLMLAQHQALPQVPDTIAENPVELLHSVISSAMEQGEINRMDAGLAVSLAIGMLLQPAVGAIYGRVPKPLSQHASTITSATFAALGVTRAP